MKKLTTKDFIEKAKEKHGDKYDYSESIYINSRTNVKIICPIHGLFLQNPQTHYLKSECPECAKITKSKKLSYSIEDFIEKAKFHHGDKYDYSKSIYKSSQEKINIICPLHGEFYQLAQDHMRGFGCAKCAGLDKKEYISSSLNEELDKYIIKNFIQPSFKEVIGSVYIFVNKTNNKKYIGKTILSINDRFSTHKYNCKKNKFDNYFYRAIRKYGWEEFDKYIIFQTELLENNNDNKTLLDAIVCDKEIEFINLFKTNIPKFGYNLTLGGDGVSGYKFSEETKLKMSISRSGEGNSMYGKTLEKNPRSIPILQLDLEGNIIKRWSCAIEINKELGYSVSMIRNCYNGKYEKYKESKWIKEQDYGK